MSSMSTEQSEQQVDGSAGGQTGAFNEQAGPGAGTEQSEQQVDGGYGGQTGAFSEQAGPGFGTEQNEQQVDGGYGGQTGAFNEQAGPGYGTEQNEQQVDGGHGGQTGAFSEQAAPRYGEQPVVREPSWSGTHGHQLFSGGSHGEATQAPVFHGLAPHQEPSIHSDVSAGMHSDEPVSLAASTDADHDYGTAAPEEPTHVSSEEHSFEAAGHAAATEDGTGHDVSGDADQAVHHG
jgi:hypothetical protein